MSMFERFDSDARERFDAASTVLQLDEGHLLLRRGEAGGDLYVLEEGALEVVDRRSDPEVILTVLGPGSIVGEVSFLDDQPRSADVRVSGPSRVRRWTREDLRRVLARDPELGAAFYEGLARTLALRLRASQGAAYALDRATSPVQHGELVEGAVALADAAKSVLLDAEAVLRERPEDPVGRAAVRAALDRLEHDVSSLFGDALYADEAEDAATRLRRELRPWLGRAGPHQRRRAEHDEASITPDLISHILADVARGDDPLGEACDRWMLSRPTLRARRETDRSALEHMRAFLPTDRARRVLLLDTAATYRMDALRSVLADAPTLLTAIDTSRALLDDLAGSWPHDGTVRLATVQTSLPRLVQRPAPALVGQDAVLVLGTFNQVPDRLVPRWLHGFRGLLSPEGRVLLTGIGESVDRAFLDRVLGWPTIRREADHFVRLVERGGFDVIDLQHAPGPGYLVVARPGRSAAVSGTWSSLGSTLHGGGGTR